MATDDTSGREKPAASRIDFDERTLGHDTDDYQPNLKPIRTRTPSVQHTSVPRTPDWDCVTKDHDRRPVEGLMERQAIDGDLLRIFVASGRTGNAAEELDAGRDG
jgi:hypothetical protein